MTMKLFKLSTVKPLKREYIYLILIFLNSWIIFLILARFILPSSKFYYYTNSYDGYLSRSKMLQESSVLANNKMKEWLINKNIRNHLFTNKHDNYLCVSVLSKNRIGSDVNYINHALMALLTRTPSSYKDYIYMNVFNMETFPENNRNLFETSQIFDIFNISTMYSRNNISQLLINDNLRVKEAFDYSLVLKWLHKKKCNYSVILEDDAIISYDWFERLSDAIRTIKSNNWSCIKLFSGYKLFDWTWLLYPSIILEILFLSLFLNIPMMIVISFGLRKLCLIVRKIYYIFSFLNIIIISCVYKSTSICPINEGIHQYTTGFGTVSILIPNFNLLPYSNHILENILKYLAKEEKEFTPKDLLLDSYRLSNNLVEYIIEPSLVQHTGMHSSVYFRDLSPNGYFRMFKSFSFVDDNKPIIFNSDLMKE